jgi:DNA repair protein RadC
VSQTISLYTLDTDGNAVPATADEIMAAAREQISRRVGRRTPLSSPKATRDYLMLKLGDRDFESNRPARTALTLPHFRGAPESLPARSTRT